ncbi:sensor histidine kinase [uncultured Microscilla sp.]|uniref:sensor histidine kinase n=1 Tax=uncultured Microscilla sp. TaxID=432653 RepID=UPI00261391FB|nr:sensor histidine kinase [uncultured Microscilla sp.]
MRCRISIIIVFMYLSNYFGYAQFNFRFKKITVKEGLSQSAVSSIIQDRFGFLWVGSRDGLNRYDGYTFKQYYHQADNPQSLPNSTIMQLSLDPQKNLWISTPGFLSRYQVNQDNFVSYPIALPKNTSSEPLIIKEIYWKNSQEALLTSSKGVILFNTNTHKVSIPKRYEKFKGVHVYAIAFDAPISEWIATHQGIYQARISDNKVSWTLRLASKQAPTYVIKTSENVVIGSVHENAYVFDALEQVFRKIPKAKGQKVVTTMKELSNNQVWISWGNVSILDTKGKYLNNITYEKNNPFSLSRDLVTSVYESQDGIIWLGTNGYGLNKLDLNLSRFGYIGAFPNTRVTLDEMYTQAMYTANDTLLYVSTALGLNIIDLFNKKSRVLTNNASVRSNRINCIVADSTQRLWLGSQDGLWKLENDQFINVDNQVIGRNVGINQILLVAPHTLMLATDAGTKLWNYQTKQLTHLSYTKSVNTCLPLPQGFLEGSRLGLREFDHQGQLKHHFKADNSQSPVQVNIITYIFRDSKQRIWLGSWGGGLTLYNPKNHKSTHYGKKDGLPNLVVYGILEDNRQHLWLSTNKGLSFFNTKTRQFRNFRETDGLQSDEFNTASFFKSPYGRMYFGGINGLTYFAPGTALQTQRYIPKTTLIGFTIDGKPGLRLDESFGVERIAQTGLVTLGSAVRKFSFEVAGLGYSLPGHTRYKYKMTPLDTRWIEMGKRRYIQFNNLAPGTYQLEVRAANSEGQWENKGLKITVIITRPLWRQWWFVALCAGLAFWLVFVLYIIRTRQLERKAQKLTATVKQRTQEVETKNNEIEAQNEELQTQAEMLIEKNELLEAIRENLEDKVRERTQNLTQLNEDLLEQNTKLEQFAFITAHNIRGPIARIQGLLQIMPDGVAPDIVGFLKLSIDELDQVIRDLVTILDVRNGVDQHFEKVELRALLMQTIQSLQDDIDKTNATINIDQFAPLTLNGVRPYFQSIFYNLIHNALKYSKDDADPVIRIEHYKRKKKVFIIVADNGLGIEMHYAKQKIFNLYQRFHPKRPGKGFGLYLVKTQLEAMKADISVASEPDKGTTFTISFPLHKA